jgi:hypothetical protein
LGEDKKTKRGRISSKKRKNEEGQARVKAKEKIVKVYVSIYITLYIFRDSATKFLSAVFPVIKFS